MVTNVKGVEQTVAVGKEEDVWIFSACDLCNANCGIRVHRINGVVVKIEGDPNCPGSGGKLCARGNAGLIALYDPNRLRTPVKRTNPEKGIGVDPKWEPITWEEGLTTVAQKLKEIRKDNPNGLLLCTFDTPVIAQVYLNWAAAFGTQNTMGSSYNCGSGIHPLTYLINGTFQQEVDLDYCNYLILVGSQYGFTAGVNIPITAQKMADARMRGLKVIVIDPVCTNAASKADEWIPIRPGTDGMLALAMLNVMLNELKTYDAEYLKKYTNAPYLINASGDYIRDTKTNKPLVWDGKEGKAKPFDAQISDAALMGDYSVDGHPCRPAFNVMAEHFKQFTPEEAARVTTVPAKTIRRITKEFVDAAKIGSEIEIGGQKLPYRPAAVHAFKGVIAHAHATISGLPFIQLNLMVGSMYVPGGYRGTNLVGPASSWTADKEADGLIVPPTTQSFQGENYYTHEIGDKDTANLKNMLAFSMTGTSVYQLCLMHPDRFRTMERPCDPKMLIEARSNLLMNCENFADTVQFLKSIPFIVCMDTEINETSEFADIVFPDTYYLERLNIFPNRMRINISPASNTFYWGIQQPVANPAYEARDWKDVLIDLAKRADFLEDLNEIFNLKLGLKEKYKLERGREYNYADIADRLAKSMFGEKMGLQWFKDNGYYSIPRKVDESYPMPFIKARIPVYFEVIKRRGEEARKVADSLGMTWWDTADYVPIPVWKPCPAYAEKEKNPDSEFNLITVNYKVPMHYHTVTTKNPWLNEVAERHPYAYKIMLNSIPAKKLGIKDGDMVWVESKVGKVKGKVKVTECIHHDAVGIAGGFGSWSKYKPIGKGKGVNFNSLLSMTPEHVDWISTAVDGCALVKVYKAED